MALRKAKKNAVSFAAAEPDFSSVEVRVSGVEGRGTYAARNIKKGEFVAPLTGTRISSEVAMSPDYDRMALQIDDDWWLEEAGYPDDFINHSCAPNLKFTKEGDGFEALQDIPKGAELFFDYATSLYDGGWSVECRCGVEDCRQKITGFQDLSITDKHRLLPDSLPYIRKKYG